MPHLDPEKKQLQHERYQLLQQLTNWLETPMLVLGFGWLLLLGVELLWGLTPVLEMVGTSIWVIFILDFLLKLLLAPHKLRFLKRNIITLISLLVPALRLFRLARVFRAARAVRGLRLVKVVGSLNRGMKALAASFGRRGVGYVLGLTGVVLLMGAAGMYAFEKDVPDGLKTYPEALWWTAMLLTSMGSDYWPRTGEGQMLCFLLALYGFAVFGYFTATLATFFMGRDAENPQAEVAGADAVAALHEEVRQLRAELRQSRGLVNSASPPKPD
ncbi:potassium channel family protein [Hymenobacter taeanensis]|uniref:Potassium channel family protein n=1 Tax=Hymenobacter taeanensis TaxID=2735321 RepID=A0A6M6BDC8_9BACT|nr:MULTISPECIES: ion transporter [Hymenobacter]QJX46227.1 potassium channel family protein [Hymenobacter taeanensis]UOQ80082.1 ion transporter [Hymenobacter sp. 5414T-23]